MMAKDHVSLQRIIVFILVDIASLQPGTGMHMQSGAGLPMHNGASIPMQSGASIADQNGASMNIQNGAGFPMHNGASIPMQSGASIADQNGASMQMNGGTGQTHEQLMMQPFQMHPHMGMHMVSDGLQNMHPVSVMQPGAQSWMQMQGNEAAMTMGNNAGAESPGFHNAALVGGGSTPNGQNHLGVYTGMPSGMETGMLPGMSQMGVGGMSPDMQQMQGQFWSMGSFPSQIAMQGNQFPAYPYSANMNGGAAADTQLAFSMLSASTPKPAANVTTTTPAGGTGSTPHPKIAYIDNQRFKDGMINWKDVAEALVQIGRVLNWQVKFNYMQ